MSDTLVSARVPRAKKERAGSVLASMGSTVSDLINSSLDYVIAEKKLPGTSRISIPEKTTDGFTAFLEATTLDVDWPAGEAADYKEFMKRERLADYESLA